MERVKEITLTTDEVVKIDTKLNMKKLMRINVDFDTDEFAALTFGRGKDFKISITQAHQAVYIAYRQANMTDYMDFSDFCDLWEFDMAIAMQVYGQLISPKTKPSKYRESIEKVTKKK